MLITHFDDNEKSSTLTDTNNDFSIKIYSTYAPDTDMTFIMQEVTLHGCTDISVLDFVFGEVEDTLEVLKLALKAM